jgi:ABC-type nickel/cobalt efflux system permease component RcnA
MVKRALVLWVIFFLLAVTASAAVGQNPFTGKKERQPASPALFPANPVLSKIALWQFQLREQMAGLVARAKQERSLRPLALLILLAFAYGGLHAAGPGHGKAVAMSYIITRQPSYARGLLFGASIALIHGIAGIAFVLIVGLILQAGITGALGAVTHVTQIVSYALIAVIGVVLIVKSILEWRTQRRNATARAHPQAPANHWAAAFAIGIVPCPGVVMVALFSVSMELIGLGVVLGLAISLGMALTISIVITAVVASKKAALQQLTGHERRLLTLETVLTAGGGILVTTFGLFFLAATI